MNVSDYARRYVAGATLAALARDAGMSESGMSKLLQRYGVRIRNTGRRTVNPIVRGRYCGCGERLEGARVTCFRCQYCYCRDRRPNLDRIALGKRMCGMCGKEVAG